jgi:hypothetical protein
MRMLTTVLEEMSIRERKADEYKKHGLTVSFRTASTPIRF